VLYDYTYFWLCPMRIKLDKILVHIFLEICMLNKSMPPLGIFFAYWLHLRWSSCCIEDWVFSEKSISFIAITFSVLISLHAYTIKTQKHLYLLYPDKFANQYLQLLVGLTTFSILKGTKINLLHLGVINVMLIMCNSFDVRMVEEAFVKSWCRLTS
jgi:hypothetical protein